MRFFILLISLIISNIAMAQIYPLEITNIKPSGTGTPAIPATNRIFRAYPGIEYNIRAAVIGGVYPYTYDLSGEPAGMTINASTGEISWANPQSNSGTITLTVTDSDSPANQAQASWVVTVSTSGFHFINSSYSGTETGSLAQPYSSLNNFLTATYEGTVTDIVYFRAGTYDMVDHNAPNPNVMNLSQNPRNWIAYPGESVILQGGSGEGQAQRITPAGPVYFDGLIMRTFVDYGLFFHTEADYVTVRRCVFDGLTPSDDVNNNYGFIHTTDTDRYLWTIQDNEFKNWRNASALGSFYNNKKILIENNHIHSDIAAGNPSGIGEAKGISPKYLMAATTIRGNIVDMTYGVPLSTQPNSALVGCDDFEICYNFFRKNGSGSVHRWNTQDESLGGLGTLYYHRNTAIGPTHNFVSTVFYATDEFTYDKNILIHDALGIDIVSDNVNCLDNIFNTTTTNRVDGNGELIGDYAQYIGTHGWQFADGSTPMDGNYTPPEPDPGTGTITIGGASTITTGGNSTITIGE